MFAAAGPPRRRRPRRSGRGTDRAGRLPAAGDLAAGPRLRPAPVLDAGRPDRRDPGRACSPLPPKQTASLPHSRCPSGTWPPAAEVLPPPGPAPGHHNRRLRRRRPGRHRPPRRRRQLDALHGEGLLTETGHRRYGMHDLIRRYARDRAAAGPPRAATRRWNGCWTTTSTPPPSPRHSWPARPAPGRPRAVPPAAVPDLADSTQALAWARAERANLLACLDHATATGQHPG